MPVEQIEPAVRLGEWFVVGATILGPVLAVQAQKWLERRQAKSGMKENIFRSLMATRAARLSTEHVQALNMIDIAFYGKRVLGMRLQTKAEKTVCRLWHEYFDSLETRIPEPVTPDQNQRIGEARDDKFNSLLAQIAIAQGYDFEALELRRRRYSPEAHVTMETQAEAIRNGLESLLNGRRPLQMEVVNLPKQPAN